MWTIYKDNICVFVFNEKWFNLVISRIHHALVNTHSPWSRARRTPLTYAVSRSPSSVIFATRFCCTRTTRTRDPPDSWECFLCEYKITNLITFYYLIYARAFSLVNKSSFSFIYLCRWRKLENFIRDFCSSLPIFTLRLKWCYFRLNIFCISTPISMLQITRSQSLGLGILIWKIFVLEHLIIL